MEVNKLRIDAFVYDSMSAYINKKNLKLKYRFI